MKRLITICLVVSVLLIITAPTRGGGPGLYLDAYDSGGNLLDSDFGPANRRYLEGNESGPGTLHVDAPSGEYISYVILHDMGNYWLVDNITTDATGVGTMTFEEFLGYDQEYIGTYYSGVTFEATPGGQDWIAKDVTANHYNESSWPSGQQWLKGYYWIYGYVSASTGILGDNGKISFNNADATYVELGYCAPEPATMCLLGLGALGLLRKRRA